MSENGIYYGIQLVIILLALGVYNFTENYLPCNFVNFTRFFIILGAIWLIYYNTERIINKYF
jgi:hypothetical protein